MTNNRAIVLPDTLVAQLIENAATLSRFLRNDFTEIAARRGALRQELIEDRQIVRIRNDSPPLTDAYAIDGAHLAEIDRASAYSVSCAVRVGQSNQSNEQSSCLAILPHVASLNTLSSGLMIMQEVMMAVQTVEDFPHTVCLVDGSRISVIIAISSFYSGIARDMPNQLQHWREQSINEPGREPGHTLRLFESRDWMTPYLTNTRIVGNLKLVTTTLLVEKYIPEWIGRFDDKTFAALVLNDGEALNPIGIQRPQEPFHIHATYPFNMNIDRLSDQLSMENHGHQIKHIYYKPDSSHGVFKIELNNSFFSERELLRGLFPWWCKEIDAPDLQEPYSFYIADRFSKEAVSVSRNALKEITRRDMGTDVLTWYFTQSYRTE